jgi:SAM-dependent methyltransferase
VSPAPPRVAPGISDGFATQSSQDHRTDRLEHEQEFHHRSRSLRACYVSSVDPLAGSQWSARGTVAGFARSAANAVLMTFAEEALKGSSGGRVLDIGCGAGRNALRLARLGWNVMGTDLSWPMLCAAASRTRKHGLDDRLHVVLAPMERIPARDCRFDLVIAHGIWNLARSAAQFRRAL